MHPTHAATASTTPAVDQNGMPPQYSLIAVFRLSSSHPILLDGRDVPSVVREFEDVVEVVRDEKVQLRGCYDVSGIRSDADLMLWLHGHAVEDLQWSLRQLRRSALLTPLIRTWSAVGVHDASQFSVEASPDAALKRSPGGWLTVRPSTQASEADGGDGSTHSETLAARERIISAHDGVLASTVAGFGFGDYDLLSAFEADDLGKLTKLSRELRAWEDGSGVKQGVPAYTGRRVEVAEIIEVLQ